MEQRFQATHWGNSEARGRGAARCSEGETTCKRGQRSGGTARSVKRSRRSHIAVLATIRKGQTWRVQISNGYVRLFGRFSSEKSARKWILAHARLRVPDIDQS